MLTFSFVHINYFCSDWELFFEPFTSSSASKNDKEKKGGSYVIPINEFSTKNI